ncbi:MAG: DnaJ C-terminal domain-containing protein [Planctomycetaceae bacterium]
MADYYQALGVSRTATAEQIRKAYKKIARENHPDVKPGDTAAAERFKQAAEAYEVLGDAEKRQQYDQYGEAYKYAKGGPQPGGSPFSGGGFRGSGPIDLGDIFGGEVDLGDIFGQAFGGGAAGGKRSRTRSRRGSDIQSEITIPFQLAATGGTYDVSVQRDGQTDRLAIKIPAGVQAGRVIRLAGQGEPGTSGGASGDLLIAVHVAPHPYFKRDGNDLIVEVPLSLTEATLGAKVDVPTLDEGPVSLTVPPGASSGARLRMRGKGIVDPKTKDRGDQFVVVKIVVPKNVSDRAKELLQELDRESPVNPRAGMW